MKPDQDNVPDCLKKLIERQVLRYHLAAPADTLRTAELSDMLLGRYGQVETILEILKDLTERGALEKTGRGQSATFRPGPRLDRVLADLAPIRTPLRAEDLTILQGKRMSISAPLCAVDAAFLEALELARERGLLVRASDDFASRIAIAADWNDYIETGIMRKRLCLVLRRMILDAAMDLAPVRPVRSRIAPEHLETIAAALEQIFDFGSLRDDDGPLINNFASCIDQRSGDSLGVSLQEWGLALYTCRPEDDYEFLPLESGDIYPDVVHVEIATGGSIILFGRDRNAIFHEVNAAHSEMIPNDFYGDAGTLQHTIETFTKTGILDISLGDVFPCIVIDRTAGRIDLVPFGESVSEETARELEAEGNRDYQSGYFFVARPGVETIDTGIEWLKIASEAQLQRFLCASAEFGPAVARAQIDRLTRDENQAIFRIDQMPERIHLYLPFGRNLAGFEAAMRSCGHFAALPENQPAAVVLSYEPLILDGVRIQMLEIAPPSLGERDGPAL